MSLISQDRRYQLLAASSGAVEQIQRHFGTSSLVSKVLAARFGTQVEAIASFLSPSLDRHWHDPLVIPDMNVAVCLLTEALDQQKHIAVFGDFDVDGMSATCLLTHALRTLGANVSAYIPHRFEEGYGMSERALTRVIADAHPDLIVTVDNGISAHGEVEWLQEQGIDVIITDHHEPYDTLPAASAVCDPKCSSSCPSQDLAGVGVVLKLVCELGKRRGRPHLWRDYLDIATLGTLSDMMALSAENRSLVFEGIQQLKRTQRPGLVALAHVAGTEVSELEADSLPFSIIPRLNAAGRMGVSDLALRLLLSDDTLEATDLAQQLEEVNNERRSLEAQLSADAEAFLEAHPESFERMIVVADESWHEGVKGIVAARLADTYHVPSVVCSIEDGLARGSGRSVGSIDLFKLLEPNSDLLVRYGGHAGAVGVTLRVEDLEEFHRRLEVQLASCDASEFEKHYEVTASVTLNEITQQSLRELECLQPFGRSNPKPLFVASQVCIRQPLRVGADKTHVRMTLDDGTASLTGIYFRAEHIDMLMSEPDGVDVVFEPSVETWQGRSRIKLRIVSVIHPSNLQQRDMPQDDVAHAFHDPLNLTDISSSSTVIAPEMLAVMPQHAYDDCLVHHFIGAEGSLLDPQLEALKKLEADHRCMCIMGTGRGKSLIFHLHAAYKALREGALSVFLFPLRALAADQALQCSDAFARLGIGVARLTGETSLQERQHLYASIHNKDVRVLFTTPEYFALHGEEITRAASLGFVVLDEAHHAAPSAGVYREAYAQIAEHLAHATCDILATSATLATEAAQEVATSFNIPSRDMVIDLHARTNLHLHDLRGFPAAHGYVQELLERQQKTLVYAATRQDARLIVAELRKAMPYDAERIVFYHAELAQEIRHRIEEAFRSDSLLCIVSTSAFGEGVNFSDIRHVVFWSFPFGEVDFNQIAGRAGRDGLPADIHLLCGKADIETTRYLLSSQAPARELLVMIWKELKARAGQHYQEFLLDVPALAIQMSGYVKQGISIDPVHIHEALDIFEELEFCNVRRLGTQVYVRLSSSPSHRSLDESVRFAEGRARLEEFDCFAQWLLDTPIEELEQRIQRPLAPSFEVLEQLGVSR